MQEMSKADAVFLGACSIMSSSINNFIVHEVAGIALKNSIQWSEKIYNETHPTLPEPKKKKKYIIEYRLWTSNDGWKLSTRHVLQGSFTSYEDAQYALGKEKCTGALVEYRITEGK
jgi:hypothetical protein